MATTASRVSGARPAATSLSFGKERAHGLCCHPNPSLFRRDDALRERRLRFHDPEHAVPELNRDRPDSSRAIEVVAYYDETQREAEKPARTPISSGAATARNWPIGRAM